MNKMDLNMMSPKLEEAEGENAEGETKGGFWRFMQRAAAFAALVVVLLLVGLIVTVMIITANQAEAFIDGKQRPGIGRVGGIMLIRRQRRQLVRPAGVEIPHQLAGVSAIGADHAGRLGGGDIVVDGAADDDEAAGHDRR